MVIFIQQVFNGLSLASIFVLVSVGITLIFGLTGIVMFAHGELLMLGALITWAVVDNGGNFFVVLPVATLVVGSIGLVLDRGLFGFTLESPVNGFIVSLGLIFVLQGAAVKLWTGQVRFIPRPVTEVWDLGGVRLTAVRVLVMGMTAALLAITFVVVKRTRYGKALRAISEDRETAVLMGVPVRRYITVVFVLGSAVAGFGGVLLVALFPVSPFIGSNFVIKGFAVALIGGLGKVEGAVVGSVVLGLVEAMSAGYLAPEWTDAYAFGAMILVILLRPQGIVRGAAGANMSGS